MPAAGPLKGRGVFLVPRIALGPMRKHQLEACIIQQGGELADHPGPQVTHVICERSVEDDDKAPEMDKLVSVMRGCHTDALVTCCAWLQEVVQHADWKDPRAGAHLITVPTEARSEAQPGQEGGSPEDEEPRSAPGKHKCPALPDPTPLKRAALRGSVEAQGPLGLDEAADAGAERGGESSSSHARQEAGQAETPAEPRAQGEDSQEVAVPVYVPNAQRAAGRTFDRNWQTALQRVVEKPEDHRDAVFMVDHAKFVVIYDKYPKAKMHLLILPRKRILSIFELTTDHLPLIRSMHELGLRIVRELKTQHGTDTTVGGQVPAFFMGFHASPSMEWLHMHVISTDLDSEDLKTKKHFNSFKPPCFLDSVELQNMLESSGKVVVDKEKIEAAEKADLQSHLTNAKMKNIPELKRHISKAASAKPKVGVLY